MNAVNNFYRMYTDALRPENAAIFQGGTCAERNCPEKCLIPNEKFKKRPESSPNMLSPVQSPEKVSSSVFHSFAPAISNAISELFFQRGAGGMATLRMLEKRKLRFFVLRPKECDLFVVFCRFL